MNLQSLHLLMGKGPLALGQGAAVRRSLPRAMLSILLPLPASADNEGMLAKSSLPTPVIQLLSGMVTHIVGAHPLKSQQIHPRDAALAAAAAAAAVAAAAAAAAA